MHSKKVYFKILKLRIWSCVIEVVKTVHFFTARTEFQKAVLKAELCFHRYVHFACVPIYIFGLHHKQCASDLLYNLFTNLLMKKLVNAV